MANDTPPTQLRNGSGVFEVYNGRWLTFSHGQRNVRGLRKGWVRGPSERTPGSFFVPGPRPSGKNIAEISGGGFSTGLHKVKERRTDPILFCDVYGCNSLSEYK